MAQVNSINNKTSQLTVDPGATANSFIQYNVNASNKFIMGIDNSASNAFKISAGSALGTTDTFITTTAGIITRPLQCAFAYRNSSIASNVTGDGTAYTLAATTKIFDQGSNFSSPTFTAPVTGYYYLSVKMYIRNEPTAASTSGTIAIITTARTYTFFLDNPSVLPNSGTDFVESVYVFTNMTAADTMTTTLTMSGGTKTISMFGSAAQFYTGITGSLIC
jgi:hypothetical protein